MNCRTLSAVVLAFGALATPARAIEMFTNFNNGTELGTRPLGIEVLSPVRYHAYPHGRWFHGPGGPCENDGVMPAPPPAQPSPPAPPPPLMKRATSARAERPKATIVEPDERRSVPQRSSNDDDRWLRSSNFHPPAQSN